MEGRLRKGFKSAMINVFELVGIPTQIFSNSKPVQQHEFGLGMNALVDNCNQVTTTLWKNDVYVAVTRKSVHVLKGFGRETDSTGWWHFAVPNGTIFLKLGTVLDYTCPAWMRTKTTTRTFQMRPTQLTWKYNPGIGAFEHPVAVRCHGTYCVPTECDTRTFDNQTTLDHPSYWKWDPPRGHHHFNRYGINGALAYWAGHSKDDWPKGVCGRKIVVDYRKYNVTDSSYLDGDSLHPLACAETHNYYMRTNNGMTRCHCDRFQKYLNCHL